MATYSLDRSLQVEEALFLDGSGQLGAEALGQRSLVADDAAASLPDRLEDGVSVPGQDGPQVNALARDAKPLLDHGSHLTNHVDL